MRWPRQPHDQSVLEASELRSLAATHAKPFVVSFYLDVDGRRYPRPSDYAPHVEQLFRTARFELAGDGLAEKALEADLAQITAWLGTGIDRSRTRGLVAFSAATEGIFETRALAVPVRDQLVVGPVPDIAQLVLLLASAPPILLVALDHERSRLLRLAAGEFEELDAPIDEIARQVDTDVELGGWGHRHEELVRQHTRRVVRAVVGELSQRRSDHVVLSGAHDLVAQLEAHLPASLSGLVVGRLQLPVTSRADELVRAAHEVVEEAEASRRRLLVAELVDRADHDAHAVTGLAATLDRLNQGSVETLLVEDGYSDAGTRCVECHALAERQGNCPRCGGQLLEVADVVDAAVTEALLHHAALEVLPNGMSARFGHIGALERAAPPPLTEEE